MPLCGHLHCLGALGAINPGVSLRGGEVYELESTLCGSDSDSSDKTLAEIEDEPTSKYAVHENYIQNHYEMFEQRPPPSDVVRPDFGAFKRKRATIPRLAFGSRELSSSGSSHPRLEKKTALNPSSGIKRKRKEFAGSLL
jgi:hypothetical protein